MNFGFVIEDLCVHPLLESFAMMNSPTNHNIVVMFVLHTQLARLKFFQFNGVVPAPWHHDAIQHRSFIPNVRPV